MAFVVIPGTVELHWRWEEFGQECETTFYATKLAGSPSNSEVDDLAQVLYDWSLDSWRTNMSDQVVFREIYAKGMESPITYQKTLAYPSGTVGLLASPAMPANVVLSVARKSSITGRSKRGRIFVGGWTETQAVGNNIGAGDIAIKVGNLTTLNGLISAVPDYYPSIVSKKLVGGIVPTGSSIEIDLWEAVDDHVDSMRRRLTGRGS